MPTATVTPIGGRSASSREPSAADICEKAADDLVEWIKLNPDKAHVRSGETPDVPRDRAFWDEVEDQLHVALEDTVRNALDNIGGPVPAAFGRRTLS